MRNVSITCDRCGKTSDLDTNVFLYSFGVASQGRLIPSNKTIQVDLCQGCFDKVQDAVSAMLKSEDSEPKRMIKERTKKYREAADRYRSMKDEWMYK